MKRVVVTGMGTVNSLGQGLDQFWPRLVAGQSGIGPITFFDASEYPCKVAAEVKNLPDFVPNTEAISVDDCRRSVRIFLESVREARRAANLNGKGVDGCTIGVAAGTSVNYVDGDLLKHYFLFRDSLGTGIDLGRFIETGFQPASSFWKRSGEMAAALPARAFGWSGPCVTFDAACAASSFAIGEAFRLIQHGEAEIMFAGGTCAIVTPLAILAFALLGALSKLADPKQASRPFDLRRDGFVMGEGAGVLVLEQLEHAQKRDARILAELIGFGATMNAHNLTDPSPSGECEEKAMELALSDSGCQPEEIDYIAAHGTSTPKNDATETSAIRRVFGHWADRLMVSSNKGQLGHTISAAGVLNAITAIQAMLESRVPPTMNYSTPDPNCDLDYVPNEMRYSSVRAALVNAFAFGGQNAVLAFRSWNSD